MHDQIITQQHCAHNPPAVNSLLMSIARKILSNTAWQFAAKFIVAAMGIMVIKITTTYLSSSGSIAAYGQYIAVYEFLAYFGIIADLGLFTIAVKEMSKDEDNIPKIIGNVITLRLILITVTMILASILVFLIPKYNYPGSRIPLGVVIASMTVFMTILNGTITSVLQTKFQMGRASLAVIIGKLISVSLMVYIIFWGFPEDVDNGFYMLIAAGIVGSMAMFAISAYYVSKITSLRPRFDMDIWRNMLKQSLPYGLALMLNTVYFRIDSLFIFFMRGEEELAVYGPAMKMLEQFTILPLYFMNSVLPVLTRTIKNQSEKYKDIIKYSFDLLSALAVPMVVGTFVLAYPIIFVIATPDFLSDLTIGFYGTDIALKILIFAILFQFINVLFAFILISVDKQKLLLYINAGCVAFNVITNLIFIPEYGFRAAAVTSVLSELFILIFTFYYAKKHLPFELPLKNFSKILFSGAVMGFAVYYLQAPSYYYLQNWNVAFLVPFGGLVYGGMILATGTVDKKMLALLKK